MCIRDRYNRGQNKIVSQQSGSLSHNENGTSEITVETIDDFLMTTPPVRLDLVKIDVEGFELNVLKGAIKTLSKYKPILFVEVSDKLLKDNRASAAQLLEFTESIGYDCRAAITNEVVQSIDDLSEIHFDIIAIPV